MYVLIAFLKKNLEMTVLLLLLRNLENSLKWSLESFKNIQGNLMINNQSQRVGDMVNLKLNQIMSRNVFKLKILQVLQISSMKLWSQFIGRKSLNLWANLFQETIFGQKLLRTEGALLDFQTKKELMQRVFFILLEVLLPNLMAMK